MLTSCSELEEVDACWAIGGDAPAGSLSSPGPVQIAEIQKNDTEVIKKAGSSSMKSGKPFDPQRGKPFRRQNDPVS